VADIDWVWGFLLLNEASKMELYFHFRAIEDIKAVNTDLFRLWRIFVFELAVFEKNQFAGSVENSASTWPMKPPAGIAWKSRSILCAADHDGNSHFEVDFPGAIFFFALHGAISFLSM
jgi:hypothetical protein